MTYYEVSPWKDRLPHLPRARGTSRGSRAPARYAALVGEFPSTTDCTRDRLSVLSAIPRRHVTLQGWFPSTQSVNCCLTHSEIFASLCPQCPNSGRYSLAVALIRAARATRRCNVRIKASILAYASSARRHSSGAGELDRLRLSKAARNGTQHSEQDECDDSPEVAALRKCIAAANRGHHRAQMIGPMPSTRQRSRSLVALPGAYTMGGNGNFPGERVLKASLGPALFCGRSRSAQHASEHYRGGQGS
jgi:hypothetical protein